ncbi:MAG: hypothetical protein HC794_09340 [Nitrospiraceae bacterium]|nr:hypothetical protein [Nitrospiraceae bacterium]
MSLDVLMREVRLLPYGQMVELAQNITAHLKETEETSVNATAIANVLSRIAAGSAPASERSMQEEQTLRAALRRVTNFTIKPIQNGWTLTCAAQNIAISGPELRPLLCAALDQIIVYYIMMKT